MSGKRPHKSSKTKAYRVGIIGAGRIAAGFDTPRDPHALTHAHAVIRDPKLALLGFVDKDRERAEAAAKKWGTKAFSSVSALLHEQPDIVVIASSDETHASLLLACARAKHAPKLIVCEKPLALRASELASLKRLKTRTQVLLDYSLRFDPLYRRIARDLAAGKYGKVISAHVTYTHGFLHNGSHSIDLARFFFGELRAARATFAVDDHTKSDPSLGGVATFARCPRFYLMPGDERSYAGSGFEILTERGRLRFIDFNYRFSFEKVIPDPHYPGFKVLAPAKVVATQRMSALENLYAHARRVIEGKERPLSSLSDAIKTQEACMRIKHSYKRLI